MRNGYTPTQLRMLAILADGLPHTREELHACISDDLAPLSAIRSHISLMRKKLRPKGEDVICELSWRRIHYRHVRLLGSANTGYR